MTSPNVAQTVTAGSRLWKRLRAGETIAVTADAGSSGRCGLDVHDSGDPAYPLNQLFQVGSDAIITFGPYERRMHVFIECASGALSATLSPRSQQIAGDA